MGCFRWISPLRLPPEFDLRTLGWKLAGADDHGAHEYARLVDGVRAQPAAPLPLAQLRRSLVLGIDASHERAAWLAHGFGDVLAADTGLDEIAVRARRLLDPRPSTDRRHGRLMLDRLVRDACVDGQRLYLNAREFSLLWRLSEDPGVPIPRAELLHDVLGLSIEPGTNALAVHICRLRKKLHSARLSHLLITGPGNGSYALLLGDGPPHPFGSRNGLDGAEFSGEEIGLLEEAIE